jgi:4-hydroxybenzoate polyprenyltransferase
VNRWLALIRFRNHVTFLGVICGALLFAPRIDAGLGRDLLLLYLSFNVLLYGGLYTINDIADREADARHPRKRLRPIPSGRIAVRTAAWVATALVVAGLACGLILFAAPVFACFAAAVAFNLMYSLLGRGWKYVDLVLNSITHPTRFLMGVLLVGRVPPASHLLALMMLAIALSCLRRDIERDAPGSTCRSTIASYRRGELPLLALACVLTLCGLAATFGAEAPGFYLIVCSTTLVLAVIGWFESPVRQILRESWTR